MLRRVKYARTITLPYLYLFINAELRFKKRHDEKGKAERAKTSCAPSSLDQPVHTNDFDGGSCNSRVCTDGLQSCTLCSFESLFKVVSPSDTIQINENGFRYFRLFSWLKLECPFTDIVLQDEDY